MMPRTRLPVATIRTGGPKRPGRADFRMPGVVLGLVLGALLSVEGWAQVKPLTVSGSVAINAEAYGQSGLKRSRRPGQSLIGTGQVSFSLYDRLTIPVTLYASTEGIKAGYQLPFNQVGISPTWSWGKVHAAYYSAQFSEFTLANSRLRGTGFEFQPGPFRIAAATGMSQRAVEPDSAGFRRGLYKRTLTAVQAGLGRENGWMLWFTGLRAEDDRESLDATQFDPARVSSPQENVVASVRFGMPILREQLALDGEVAASAYSENTLARELDDEEDFQLPSSLENLFTPRLSSRADYAWRTALKIAPVNEFLFQIEGRKVGPGFKSLGARQVETDIFDLLINPSLQLRTVRANVSIGLRENNVANTRQTTTKRTIVNANLSVRPNQAFNVIATYSNFGIRNSEVEDTLRIQNVSQLLSLAPSIQFEAGASRHNLRASYNYQDFKDENVVSGREGDTKNHNMNVGHTVSWMSGLSLTTSATYVVGLTSSIDAKILSLTEAVGHQFMDRKMRVNASVTLSRTTTVATDNGIQGRVQLLYNFTRRNQLQVSGQVRSFSYGQERSGSEGYTETIARVGYRLSF